MSLASVRVYVGGLPPDVARNELQERFGRFVRNARDCQLTHVELPKRKALGTFVPPSERCRGFAYLTLQGTDAATQSDALQKTYNRTKWRGSMLQVQVAKPHFKLKLEQEQNQREVERRERERKRRDVMTRLTTRDDGVEPLTLTVAFTGRKTTKFAAVDEVEDGVTEEIKAETDTEIVDRGRADEGVKEDVIGEDEVEAFVRKMEEKAVERKQSEENKVLLSREEVNARRLAALDAKKKRRKTRKETVVIPAIGEAVGNTKITFDDSGNEQEPEKQEKDDTGVVLNWMDSSDDEADGEKAARGTFDFTGGDDDDTKIAAADAEVQAAFALRPEFVGEKGKKLFEMQKRFGGDSRFRLDARFLEEKANEYGGNDVEDDEQQVDETGIAELQSFIEEESLQEAARHAREMREEEEEALRVVSKLFPDVDVTRLQRRMQEQRAPKDPLKEAAWMGELKRYDPRDAGACLEFEIPMTVALSGAQKDEEVDAVPKREVKGIPTGGDRFFSTANDLSNLFSRVRKNSEDGEEGEAALDGVFGLGTASTETGSVAPFKLSSIFSFPVGEDKPLAAIGEQLLEDEQEESRPSVGDWVFSQGFRPTDDMADEAMATDSEAGDDGVDEVQMKAALTKQHSQKSLEDFLAFGKTFVGGEEVADWPERRKKLTLDYKRKRRDAVKMKKRQNKQQNKANKTKTDATATGAAVSSKWKKVRL